MKLRDFLHRTYVIIPLSNGVTYAAHEVHVRAALGIFNTWFYTL